MSARAFASSMEDQVAPPYYFQQSVGLGRHHPENGNQGRARSQQLHDGHGVQRESQASRQHLCHPGQSEESEIALIDSILSLYLSLNLLFCSGSLS